MNKFSLVDQSLAQDRQMTEISPTFDSISFFIPIASPPIIIFLLPERAGRKAEFTDSKHRS